MAVLLLGADVDPDEEFRMMLKWHKPAVYPRTILEGMDLETLSTMLDSGNLQWYEPRPEQDRWDVVVGMKIHAPPEEVWKVATDYELYCEIMPDSFAKCKTEYRKGNEVKNIYEMQTSVFMYTFTMDVIDIVQEEPPYKFKIKTIEGGVKGREIEILIIPIDNNTHTIFFMRTYPQLVSMGWTMRQALKALPMAEPAAGVGACNYTVRAYKNEAEKRAGYTPSPKPGELNIKNLDLTTLRLIDKGNGGLIRETPEGKTIDALTYTFIDAPPDRVWETITDFEHYPDIFSAPCEVESRKGNQVTVTQKTASFSVMGLKFGYELHARYTLDAPRHMSYAAIDGVYEGSHGDFTILPIDGANNCILFSSGGINMENDNAIVSRIAKTGAFPLENMIDMMLVRSTLAHIRIAAESSKAPPNYGEKR
jgi:uncharacterized protein YndB with AHSA1/START domain